MTHQLMILSLWACVALLAGVGVGWTLEDKN